MEEWMIYVLKINLLAAEDRASAAVLQEEERLSAFPETETGSREQETFSVEQEKEVLPAASAEGEKDTVPSMESSGAYREQPAEETAPLRTEAAGLRDSTDSLKDRILYMTRSRTLKSGMILSVLLMAAVVLSNLLVGCSLEAAPREEREEQQEPPVREPEEPEKENSAGQETQEEPAFPPGTGGGGLTAQELEDLLGLPYIGNQLLASSEEIPLPSGGVSGLRYDLDEDGVLEILAGAVEQQGGSSFFSLRVFEWENGGWTEADRRSMKTLCPASLTAPFFSPGGRSS